jgi:hypothetical protein
VNIRFTSSLTPEDENLIAPVVLNALAGILDLLPIAYAIRIDTADARVYQHTGPLADSPAVAEPLRMRSGPTTHGQVAQWAQGEAKRTP